MKTKKQRKSVTIPQKGLLTNRKERKPGKRARLMLYHSTTPIAAKAILATAFEDNTGHYLTNSEFTGVWLADCPLDENEGCKGGTVLVVSGLEESDIADYEWIEEGKPYREWLVPALMLNDKVTIELESLETE